MKIKISQLRKVIREVLEEEMDKDLPSDYEECGECGYDHSYEQEEAAEWHKKHE